MIVRMAIFTYHKPGLKKIIIELEGFVPRNTELVNLFCTYLRLYDIDYVHHYLRTVGKKTQGDLNMKSIGERNGKIWQVRHRNDAMQCSFHPSPD
jgi:hypothetical protein